MSWTTMFWRQLQFVVFFSDALRVTDNVFAGCDVAGGSLFPSSPSDTLRPASTPSAPPDSLFLALAAMPRCCHTVYMAVTVSRRISAPSSRALTPDVRDARNPPPTAVCRLVKCIVAAAQCGLVAFIHSCSCSNGVILHVYVSQMAQMRSM